MFGLACVALVLALVANTVAMAVRERVREMAVMRTLGYHESHLVLLVVDESLMLAVLGAALGIVAALLVVHFTQLTIGVEGVLVTFALSPGLVLRGLAVACLVGIVAAALPALAVARARIPAALRGA
jgi:putative ABC transport system permease protein